jgi:hypothetical protein
MTIVEGASRVLAAKAAGAEMKVFDWNKAAQLISDRGIRHAAAGLREDMGCTAVVILENGEPLVDADGYLASFWAIPVLAFFPKDDPTQEEEQLECYALASTVPWHEYDILSKRPVIIDGNTDGGKVK